MKQRSNEKEKPLAGPTANGSKVNKLKVSHRQCTVAGNNRQEQLLRDIEEVTRILGRYGFPSHNEPVLRHTVYGLTSIRTITESMEYAINHPDEDTPGCGRARWGYLKEEGRAK